MMNRFACSLVVSFFLSTGLVFMSPSSAFAGEGVTLVFSSGAVVKIRDGYKQVIEGMKQLRTENTDYAIVEMNIGGNSFAINLSEVVVVCRDECSSMEILRAPGGSQKR